MSEDSLHVKGMSNIRQAYSQFFVGRLGLSSHAKINFCFTKSDAEDRALLFQTSEKQANPYSHIFEHGLSQT